MKRIIPFLLVALLIILSGFLSVNKFIPVHHFAFHSGWPYIYYDHFQQDQALAPNYDAKQTARKDAGDSKNDQNPSED